ncbi:hypothetical protein Tco_0660023 [Tanacetum coccineum]
MRLLLSLALVILSPVITSVGPCSCCFVIFDLLAFVIVHTLHHLESLLTISLIDLIIYLEGRSCISEFVRFNRISLTGFPAQSVGSSNTDVLDLPCLLVLITRTSQSRQHGFGFATIVVASYGISAEGITIARQRGHVVMTIVQPFTGQLLLQLLDFRLPKFHVFEYMCVHGNSGNRNVECIGESSHGSNNLEILLCQVVFLVGPVQEHCACEKPPRCDLCKIFGHVHDHCPKKVLIPPTVVTSNVATPTVEKTNGGFQTVGKKKKKGKSKSTNGGQFGGHSIKQIVRYEPKATTSAPKKGVNNVGNASKSSSMLKTFVTSTKKGNITTSNMYDESANLFQSTKTSRSSSTFTAVAG